MARLAHPRKQLLFSTLSLADLGLTWFLLHQAGARAHESNPVASLWLASFGWLGLVGFKLGIVLLVAALAQVVSRERPRAAGRILAFGCSTLLIVLLYSGSLMWGAAAEAGRIKQAEERGRDLEAKLLPSRAYCSLRERLGHELVARRCTLAEAVETLAVSEYVQDPAWLQRVTVCYPAMSRCECLATQLLEDILVFPDAHAPGGKQLLQELDAQFRSCFGRPAPCLAGSDETSVAAQRPWRGTVPHAQ
jgi:hypothetical protein